MDRTAVRFFIFHNRSLALSLRSIALQSQSRSPVCRLTHFRVVRALCRVVIVKGVSL